MGNETSIGETLPPHSSISLTYKWEILQHAHISETDSIGVTDPCFVIFKAIRRNTDDFYSAFLEILLATSHLSKLGSTNRPGHLKFDASQTFNATRNGFERQKHT